MKKFKEKSFTVDVELTENHPDIIQVMLENLYNNGNLRYDDIHLNAAGVVSDRLYKGLSYGSIDSETLAKKAAIEKDGYHLEYIFTITEKLQDPFIDCDVFRPENWCVREDIHYTLKLKFYFTKLEEISEEEDNPPAKPKTEEKINRYMFPRAKFKFISKHKQRTTVPF